MSREQVGDVEMLQIAVELELNLVKIQDMTTAVKALFDETMFPRCPEMQ